MQGPSNQSEVRRLLEQIDAEYEAAKHGLQGVAQGMAHHQFMTARAENIQALQKRLGEVVGDQDTATRLVIQHQATQQAASS